MDDDFEDIIAAGKLRKVHSWYKNLGLRVQTHRDQSITWIDFDKSFDPLQWVHLPIHQIIWENNRPDLVCLPTCVWVEISSGEKIIFDVRY